MITYLVLLVVLLPGCFCNSIYIVGADKNLTEYSFDLSSGTLTKQSTFPYPFDPFTKRGLSCFTKQNNGTFFIFSKDDLVYLDVKNFQVQQVQPMKPVPSSVVAMSYDSKSNLLYLEADLDSSLEDPSVMEKPNTSLLSLDSKGTLTKVADTGYRNENQGLMTLDMTNKVAYYNPGGMFIGLNLKTGEVVATVNYSGATPYSLDFYQNSLYILTATQSGPVSLATVNPTTGNVTTIVNYPDNLIVNNPQLTFLDQDRGIHYALFVDKQTSSMPLLAITNLPPTTDPIILKLTPSFPSSFTASSLGVMVK